MYALTIKYYLELFGENAISALNMQCAKLDCFLTIKSEFVISY